MFFPEQVAMHNIIKTSSSVGMILQDGKDFPAVGDNTHLVKPLCSIVSMLQDGKDFPGEGTTRTL